MGPVRMAQETASVDESSFLNDIVHRATFVIGYLDKEPTHCDSTTLRIYKEASVGSLAISLLAGRERSICGYVCNKG